MPATRGPAVISPIPGGRNSALPTLPPSEVAGDAAPLDAFDLAPTDLAELAPEELAPELPPADELCVPECPGDCGPDGCGGSCGLCPTGVPCVAGLCQPPQPCESSKECDEGVCDKQQGICVECVADADCDDGFRCVGQKCLEAIPCVSDKDCKGFGMICDKQLGFCVECLTDFDCPLSHYCQSELCLPDLCTPGEKLCLAQAVLTCAANGSAFLPPDPCPEQHYCTDGQCLPWQCLPGLVECQDELLVACEEDGSGIAWAEDCSEQEAVCLGGSCQPVICTDGLSNCQEGDLLAVCSLKGTWLEVTPCPQGHYCDVEDAACLPWSCPPGAAFCQGKEARLCNQQGSDSTLVAECLGETEVCSEGECVPQICQPGASWCADNTHQALCDAVGAAYATIPCTVQQSCWSGACHNWNCTPGKPYCAGTAAFVCDALGAGPVGPGEQCDQPNKKCVDGACVCAPLTCQALNKSCGQYADGCGATLDCGGCQPGQTCVEGSCKCLPDCTNKKCGPDGCGGICGTCPLPKDVCEAGQCVCKPDSCTTFGYECGSVSNGCGATLNCGACPTGKACQNGKCVCVPNCAGKQCGFDGCGGSCGSCGAGTSCYGFQCLTTSTLPGCTTSSSAGCGGCACQSCVCASDSYCCSTAWDWLCEDACLNTCGGCTIASCGNGVCQAAAGETCSSCNSDCFCPAGLKCHDGTCCTANCAGKQCGSDGCGGSCGTCTGAQEVCQYNQCVCVPDSCGYYDCSIHANGRGGQMDCGGCPTGYGCQGQTCVCIPNCAGKVCGYDGCGGTCGYCAGTCAAGKCYNGKGCNASSYPGCDGCACQGCVCAADPYCCNTAWDSLCATSCATTCGGCG